MVSGAQIVPAYPRFLLELKARILQAQLRAAVAVNRELLALYWSVGRDIVARQEREGWGTAVIDRLGKDLQTALPGVQGFGMRNLWRMRAFYLAYWTEVTDSEFVTFLPQAVAEIPWGHHVLLLEKVQDPEERLFYARSALANGGSRSILTVQIEAKLAQRLQGFLLELGVGFAFVGRQVPILVGKKERYLDPLFYHLKLRCFVVIELKTVPFEPEFAGKLNFYLSAVDSQMRPPQDGPTIGLILCKEKERLVAEYALRDLAKPIGIAEWKTRLAETLPEDMQSSLPTIEDIERELGEKLPKS